MSFDPTKKPTIPIFNGNNAVQWTEAVSAAMAYAECHSVVIGRPTYPEDFEKGSDGKPKLNDDGTSLHLLSNEKLVPGENVRTKRPILKEKDGKPTEESIKAVNAWDTKNDTALGIIRAHLAPEYRHLMQHSNKASEIWDKILQDYIKPGRFKAMDLFREFFYYKLDIHKPIRPQMAKLDSIRSQLAGTWVDKIPPECFPMFKIMGLPKELDPLVMSLLGSYKSDELPSNEDLVTRLADDEARRKDHRSTAPSTSLNNVSKVKHFKKRCTREGCPRPETHDTANHWERGQRPGNNSGNNNNQNKKGGGNRSKFKKGGGGRNNFKQKQASVHAVTVQEAGVPASTTIYTASAYIEGSTLKDTRWMCDSGATHHITNNFEDFTSYTPNTIPGRITMGNGAHIPIVGAGKVHLFTKSSIGEMIELQLNVLYVPEAKNRFFSLRVPLTKGGEVQMDGTKIKLMKKHNDNSRRELFTAAYDTASKLYWLDAQVKSIHPEDVNRPSIHAMNDVEMYNLWHQ